MCNCKMLLETAKRSLDRFIFTVNSNRLLRERKHIKWSLIYYVKKSREIF